MLLYALLVIEQVVQVDLNDYNWHLLLQKGVYYGN